MFCKFRFRLKDKTNTKMEEGKNEAPSIAFNAMDSELGQPKTAEITLAAAMNYSDCPVCFETLMPPIYQCCNGHIVCCNCAEKIDKCVECRVPVSRSSKIRNIALEKIVNNLYVDCSNKNEGCVMKVTVEWLRNHLQVCPYTPFNFCSTLLGWTNCEHLVNDLSVLSHLETCHSITKVKSNTFQMCLNVSRIPMGENVFFFEPFVVTSMEIPVLIRSVVTMDGYFTFTGFTLQNQKAEPQNIRLKFRIEAQKKAASFEWSGYVQSYRTFEERNIINSFRIPVESLIELCGPNVPPQQITAIKINVSVWEQSISSQTSQDGTLHEEVHIFEQSNLRVSERAGTLSASTSQLVRTQTQDVLLIDDFTPLENTSFGSFFSDF